MMLLDRVFEVLQVIAFARTLFPKSAFINRTIESNGQSSKSLNHGYPQTLA